MLGKKVKLSKKEIKEDKLVAAYYKSVAFLDQYKKQFAIYGGILIAIIAIVVVFKYSRAQSNDKAGIELSRVMDLYDQGAFLEAITGRLGTKIMGLKKLVEEYGSTENGETAKIYLANSYNMLGKFDDAFKYYDDYSGGLKMYKAAALAGKGGIYAVKKDYKKAAETFYSASKVSKEISQNADYLLSAGQYFYLAGDKEQAKEVLEKLKKDYDESMASRQADQYLALLEED